MVTTRAASLSCLGFIFGMCWLISQVATPLAELSTPLVMGGDDPGSRDGGLDGRTLDDRNAMDVESRFDRPTAVDSATPDAGEVEFVFVAAPAGATRAGGLPSPVNNSAAPVIVDVDAGVQKDLPQLVEGDSGTAGRPVPEAVVVERTMPGLHLLAAFTPGDAGPGAASAERPWPAPPPREYTVKSGDSLAKIARLFLGSASPEAVAAIVASNPKIDGRRDRIFVGEVLVVPTPMGTNVGPSVTKAENAAPAGAKARDYTVRPGDSLVGIARRYLQDGDRWREIAVLNDLSNADKIIPGTRIMLPPVRNDT